MKMRSVAYTTLVCLAVVTVLINLYPWTVSDIAWGVVEFEVPQGAMAADVAGMLSDRGLIVNKDIFVAGAVLLGIDRKFVAGKYVLPPRMGLMSLYELLQRGQHQLNLVTVPEGLTLEETSRTIARQLGLEDEGLASWGSDQELIEELGIEGDSVEGYLFPDSYDIPHEAHPRDIISTMVGRAMRTFADVVAGSQPKLTRREIFTLASIVEAEVTYVEEAPRVAAVFLNRLRMGMPLQADPTVAYALGERKQRITYSDLEVDSPYNTYRYRGLPPGPICSPGESSIRAVLNPLVPSSEIYFVARGDGRHIFSETIDEHIRAKRDVRSGRAQERRRREAEETEGTAE